MRRALSCRIIVRGEPRSWVVPCISRFGPGALIIDGIMGFFMKPSSLFRGGGVSARSLLGRTLASRTARAPSGDLSTY